MLIALLTLIPSSADLLNNCGGILCCIEICFAGCGKEWIRNTHNSYHERIMGEEAHQRLKLFGSPCYLTLFLLVSYSRDLNIFRILNKKGQIGVISERFKSKERRNVHLIIFKIDPALRSIRHACTKEEYHLAEE